MKFWKLCFWTLLCIGCRKGEILDVGSYLFQIHLQKQFEGERIVIYLDGKKIYDYYGYTSKKYGYLWHSKEGIYLDEGPHTLHIVVDDRFSKTETFLMKSKSLYAGITFKKKFIEPIFLDFQDVPFEY